MTGFSTKARRCAIGFLAVALAAALCPLQALAAPGGTVVHKKSGMNIDHTILRDAGPGQGGVELARVPDDAVGTVVVPVSIMVMEDWEKPATYAVEGIAANAFSGASAASGELSRIVILGSPDIDPSAFAGLAESTAFTVGDQAMAERLREAGIAPARVTVEPLLTLYVAFGDSIAAGYALSEYDNSNLCEDEMPTPSDAFVSLVGAHLEQAYGPSFTDNLATSGWTSQQLLDALRAGMYDASLADATLVSVTIGSNDLLGRFMEIITEALKGIDDLSEEDLRTLEAQSAAGSSPEAESAAATVEETGEGTSAGASPEAQAAASGESAANEEAAAAAVAPAATGGPSSEGEEAQAVAPRKRPTPVRDLVDRITAAIAQINAAIDNDPQLLAACETFASTNQPAILSELHKRALNAQVYWTTLYNPFYGQTLDLRTLFPNLASRLVGEDVDLSIDLSAAGARYIELMNQAFVQNTEGYVAVDLYEPFNHPGLTNVSIGRAPDGTISFGVDPHPNHDGHALITRLLNDAIDATYRPAAPEPEPKQTPIEPAAGKALAATGDGSAAPLAAGSAVAALTALAACGARRARGRRDRLGRGA